MARSVSPAIFLLVATWLGCTPTREPARGLDDDAGPRPPVAPLPGNASSTPGAGPAASPAASAAAARPVSSEGAAGRCSANTFRCQEDADCVTSCAHGAVAKKWWVAQYPGGEACEDGCASKGSAPPRCLKGTCTAFRGDARDDACTCRDARVAEGVGPAHRCSKDDDCTMSCAFGALRKDWYSTHGLASHECKDGCAEYAEVRCRTGVCTAERQGKLVADCTRRSVHPASR